ncbi:malonyl-CoA:anthocyanidin 5-O-glucoside-6''-O-malonyltransferase-like [Vicia villosa]|uniref:malonyl-CoA:anthocyanidin 5-O-glucoside-6''-O-malonyltransferase-like n=1 Tax=Vicia villosa TaxID=3911 RepID=UPI00273ACF1E|nr:malonyl-CoA:anthocyanidin 5-O-glucoside-6''-O-malonyltransferase-like [Vicia villosa]
MASNKNNIKIHEHIKVVPPSSSTQTTTTTPLTFFDIIWLRFHPAERIYFYTLHDPHSHPSFFFQEIVPNLKSSLSLTLQHFLPLAGKIVWPSDSSKPFIQFDPSDDDIGVSLHIVESDADFNHVIGNSPHEASLSRSFIPHLESSDSFFASIISLQITFFPNCGFSIGITAHHGVFDGKSLSMFIKAWAYLCNKIIGLETPTLLPELEPLFNTDIIIGTNENNLIKILSKIFPSEKGNERSLKIFPYEPKLEDSLRATFKLTRADLDKIKQDVLSKWEIFNPNESKPQTLSSFTLTCAHSLVCIAKSIHEVEQEKEKFAFAFAIDCRARLETPLPNNYFGNCVLASFINTQPIDFINEDGVFVVAKCIYEKIKMINKKGIFEESIFDLFDKYRTLNNEGYETFGVAGSNKLGAYKNNFGYGRPEKVELVSIDKDLSIGFGDSGDGDGEVEIGLVLNKHVMNTFSTLFLEGLCVN